LTALTMMSTGMSADNIDLTMLAIGVVISGNCFGYVRHGHYPARLGDYSGSETSVIIKPVIASMIPGRP
jgi:hypothetical protein